MATATAADDDRPVGSRSGPGERSDLSWRAAGLAEPSAALVLHRVLASAARTFLLCDLGDELVDDDHRHETVDARSLGRPSRPVWAEAVGPGGGLPDGDVERVHESRVALRRVRANLRTYRLALDPGWATSLRAEAAWYGRLLGQARDLDVLRRMVTEDAAGALDGDETSGLVAVIDAHQGEAAAELRAARGSARRFQLTEQLVVLWEGPAYKAKADRAAHQVLPAMLERAWHDVRGAARSARKHPTDVRLHKLRIRTKDLRYGCETLALVEGRPAAKVAKAAQRLQTTLGDVHDAAHAIEWFGEVGRRHRELARAADRMVEVERRARSEARKGWRRQLKEVERRWRRLDG